MKINPIILFFISILIFASCDDDLYKDITLKGKINGHVEGVFDESENSISKKNVKIEIVNEDISATTDESGKFTLKNVTTGTYDIRFSREDLDNYEIQSVQFLGGETPYVIDEKIVLLQKSTTVPSNLTVTVENETVNFQCYVSPIIPENESRNIIFYVYSDNTVSPENYLYYFVETITEGSILTVDKSLSLFNSYNTDNLHVVAYGYTKGYYNTSFNQNTYLLIPSYIERATGEILYSGLNVNSRSNIVNFTF